MLTLLAYLLIASVYSFSVPLFEAPDEPSHLSYVNFVASKHMLPNLSTGDVMGIPDEAFQAPLFYVIAGGVLNLLGRSEVNPRIERNPEFSWVHPSTPPNMFLHSPRETVQPDSFAVHLLRLISVLAGVTIVYLTYKLSLEIRLTSFQALLAAGINAFIPQFTFLTGSVSNDSLSWAMSSLALLFTLRLVAKQSVERAFLISLGITLGLAFLTKTTTLALIPVVIAAMLVKRFHLHNWNTRDLTKAALLVGGVAFSLAGWWYLRNFVLYGELTGWKLNAEINHVLIHEKTIWSSYFRTTFPVWLLDSFWAVFG